MATPVVELDERFSSEEAEATHWAQAQRLLAQAEIFWLSTVRPDGRPHVTPVLSVWHDDMVYFCTGPSERKALNLLQNRHVALTTGTNDLAHGLDVVAEGSAMMIVDEEKLTALAAAYERKYGEDWRFEVRDNAFYGDGGTALVFEVSPTTIFGFAKSPFAQTRYRFPAT